MKMTEKHSPLISSDTGRTDRPEEIVVSVIVPVYNISDYLSECVDSLLSQSFGLRYEIILVDDGSTDDSGGLCEKFAANNPDVVRVIHRKNGGISAARNDALDVARGQYIFFMDGDDILAPDALEILVRYATETGSDVVVAQLTRDLHSLGHTEDFRSYIRRSEDAIEGMLLQKKPEGNSAWNKLYSRNLFDGLRFKEGTWFEDLQMYYRLLPRAGKVCIIPDVLYYYRPSVTSFLLNRCHPGQFDILAVVTEIEQWAKTLGDGRIIEAADDRYFAALCTLLPIASLKGDKALADDLYRQIRARRRAEIFRKGIRLKNRVAAVCAYGGQRFMTHVLTGYARHRYS